MRSTHIKPALKPIVTLALSLSLGACAVGERIKNIGKAPDLTPIENVVAPMQQRSLSLPMPEQPQVRTEHNSLWRTGARSFFKDQRAARIGDILTVMIEIEDEAKVDNSTTRSRNSSEQADLSRLLGLESQLSKILPNAVDPSQLTQFGSTSSTQGSGQVDRSEDIKLTVAAIVTHILPNGNMIIQGRQEVRVNFEVRELQVAGVVRPEDISKSNTIRHSQIAEARISYGGRGQLTDMQQARYGQQLYEILFPF